jgi:hypothetical protein
MPRRWFALATGVAVSLLVAGCGGGDGGTASGAPAGQPPVTTARPATTTTSSTVPAIEGVRTSTVEAGHREGTITYPDTPPIGGVHNPVWMPCGFYDQPVPNERAVHSLEHGAVWITYRPDLPAEQVDRLATLAGSRKDVLVSRWDEGLPSPLVATAWGRQLRLESAADPRLAEFVRVYANKGPEPNAAC